MQLPVSLLLPPLPANGEQAKGTHTISSTAHWVVPKRLMQGDGSNLEDIDAQIVDVGESKASLASLTEAVQSLEKQVRAGDGTFYVHAGSDEGQPGQEARRRRPKGELRPVVG